MSRLIRPCENVAPELAYDGPNVVRTGSDNSTGSDWTFIHGPGVDDPLLGRYSGSTKVAFFVTDGAGRQLVVVSRDGTDFSAVLEYTQQGGKYAGGTSSGSSFGADRYASANVSGVSFFRNRVYDQETGRWTQEDPIGVAGGLNLYQFNGNNPATFTDPFGLKVCFQGNGTDRAILEFATEMGTGTDIVTGDDGCVTEAKPNGRKGFRQLQLRLQHLIDDSETFNLRLYDGSSGYFEAGTANIGRGVPGGAYAACPGTGVGFWDWSAVVVHELLGHGTEGWVRAALGRHFRTVFGINQNRAIDIENEYHAAAGQALRCSE